MIPFMDRHFSSLIAAVVAIIVGLSAYYVSIKQVEIAEIESERQSRIEAAKFITQNHTSIFGKDSKTRERFFEIIELAYPPELSAKLRLQMFDQYTIETTDLLLTFLQTNGQNFDTQNKDEFVDWLRENDPKSFSSLEGLADPVLIKTFMSDTDNAVLRRKAAKDLNLENRVNQYSDLSADVFKIKKKEFEDNGSEVFINLQNYGKYHMTVIHPK
jgi:hypothetical protein